MLIFLCLLCLDFFSLFLGDLFDDFEVESDGVIRSIDVLFVLVCSEKPDEK